MSSLKGKNLRSKTKLNHIWSVKHGLLIQNKDGKLNVINKKFYQTFADLNARCTNKNVASYKYAGGRGIICEWNNIDEFKGDMYQSYLEHIKTNTFHNTTIDRIDVNGNYCKENCRWASQFEQSRNKRNLRMITFNGKTQCAIDWEKELGLYRNCIYNRVNVRGATIEEALTNKIKFRRNVKIIPTPITNHK